MQSAHGRARRREDQGRARDGRRRRRGAAGAGRERPDPDGARLTGPGISPGARGASGTFAAIGGEVDNRIPVLAPLVGTFYEARLAGREGLRRGRPDGRRGRHRLHRRGDEADERGRRVGGRESRRDRRHQRRAGGVRAGADVPRAARRPSMFEKVLIANRGEIALRVARACRELGIKTVAVYSTADADSAVVNFADEAVKIGPPPAARSYIHIPSVIGAALKTGADAIHPGYGFLSEDPYFAEICADHDITFIGPRPDVMEKVGDKAIARGRCRRRAAAAAGHDRAGRLAAGRTDVASEIGYPLIIKAVAGGGGRGMNVVRAHGGPRAPLPDHARHRAGGVQGQRVYIERYLEAPRHTEVQFVVRQPRQRRPPLRARLLGAAPAPEADRGGAVDPPRAAARATSASAPSAGRCQSATPAPARWSSCSTARATSRSWR